MTSVSVAGGRLWVRGTGAITVHRWSRHGAEQARRDVCPGLREKTRSADARWGLPLESQ